MEPLLWLDATDLPCSFHSSELLLDSPLGRGISGSTLVLSAATFASRDDTSSTRLVAIGKAMARVGDEHSQYIST